MEIAGGYYIARYEASSSDETQNRIVESKENVLPWVNITQLNAAIKSREMDNENVYYKTDLINSLAWDTALVFIQRFGDKYYTTKSIAAGSGALNTGKLNINDMAGNMREWSTETSTHPQYHNVLRGEWYKYGGNSDLRYREIIGYKSSFVSFRPIMYL